VIEGGMQPEGIKTYYQVLNSKQSVDKPIIIEIEIKEIKLD
jgi:hypothetical protein